MLKIAAVNKNHKRINAGLGAAEDQVNVLLIPAAGGSDVQLSHGLLILSGSMCL